MAKLRLVILLLTFIIVGAGVYFFSRYAKGYSFDIESLKFLPNGLLVLKSYPDGAQIVVDNKIATATNATLRLPPQSYEITIRKEGYREWKKTLTVEKEEVTEATAHLFKVAPSLSAFNFSPTLNPVPSKDFTKIAYYVPPHNNGTVNNDIEGLWIMENLNLPLGFNREPKRITEGNVSDAQLVWSPDGREIIMTTKEGVYLLNSGIFTPKIQRVDISATKDGVLKSWHEINSKRLDSQMRKLPEEIQDLLKNKTKTVTFSPDEEMVLYTASQSADLANDLIPRLPGSSTQNQQRNIKAGETYVYDIQEDRNFLIEKSDKSLVIEGGFTTDAQRRLSWFPTSRHLVLAQPNSITIMDYDGTNRQDVYQGVYVAPHAYPATSTDKLMILTNLGAQTPPNLYFLSLK